MLVTRGSQPQGRSRLTCINPGASMNTIWYCPVCGAPLLPFHSTCRGCGEEISKTKQCLVLIGAGYMLYKGVQWLGPIISDDDTDPQLLRPATQPQADKRTSFSTANNAAESSLHRAHLSCGHVAWLPGEPRVVITKSVICHGCLPNTGHRTIDFIHN